MFDLSQKNALITGAAQGVGAGIARALAQQGASVAVNDILVDMAAATAEEINAQLANQAAANGKTSSASQAIAVPFDVTDLKAVTQGFATAAEQLGGPIDILVNNAGKAGASDFVPTPFAQLDPNDWPAFINANLYGVLNCTKAVLDSMIARRWGRIITISSGAGQMGLPIGVSVYGAGKGGAAGFMRHIAIENSRHGITANSLSLGLMDTLQDPKTTAEIASRVPVGRLGTPGDIGAACVWLASDEAEWVTAQTININGGSLQS